MKRSFSLMEVLLGSVLMAFLVSLLIGSYLYFSKERRGNDRLKEKVLAFTLADEELENIFSKIKLSPYFFSTSENSLVFTYDRGVDKLPELSGEVLGHLFFDTQQGKLMLAIFPHPEDEKRSPARAFVLLEGVSDPMIIDYYFPSISDLAVNPEKVGSEFPREGWQKNWRAEFGQLPLVVRLTFTWQDKLFELKYDLPYFAYSIKIEGFAKVALLGKIDDFAAGSKPTNFQPKMHSLADETYTNRIGEEARVEAGRERAVLTSKWTSANPSSLS